MTLHHPIPRFQRALGTLAITAMQDQANISRLNNLRQEGSYRAIFPRPSTNRLDAVAVNTAGGATGGDQFTISIEAQENAEIAFTTQAAERIYKAAAQGQAHIVNTVRIAKGAKLYWVPQETILFDGCRLNRSLDVDVHPKGSALILEPLVFGRAASGESLKSCTFHDRITITSDGRPLYIDQVKMDGDLAASLARPAIASGAQAMANLVFVDAQAGQILEPLRDLLPPTAGASLLSETVLVVRLLASDSFALRATLLSLLRLLTNDTVPKNWRL